jgi:hypothetical protein
MKITQIIELLESELSEQGDVEVMIYNSSGELIDPKGFSGGGMSTDEGFIDTISFSDLE